MPPGIKGFQKGHPTFISRETYKKRKPDWVKEKIRNTLIGRPLSETTRLKMMGRIP